MLVLFETPAGFALFKVLNDGKLKNVDKIHEEFETAEKANKIVSLKAFDKFENMTEALSASTALVESKLDKGLKKFLKKSIVAKDLKEELAVSETKLGNLIKSELGIKIVHDNSVLELIRGIRLQINSLVTGLGDTEMKAMALGLSHSLSRYKLKFSPDKVDTMIVQAIGLLDDLDKELNIYAMRVKEWYGWHFPELVKVVTDNIMYAKTVKKLGLRTNLPKISLSDIIPEELEAEVREVAQVSMGTEITDEDVIHVVELCDQVINIAEYREQLFEYLKNRMQAIAPNLTVLVGELVGARLIAHAGSLMNLAKQPASTVQILGAEKALFRALKTKHETPKYGLIYHASLIGQTAPKNKGKISRLLAAKTALSVRVDALSEDKQTPEIGFENKAKIEARMRQLEGKGFTQISGQSKAKAKMEKYDNKRQPDNQAVLKSGSSTYNTTADSTLKEKKNKKDQEEKIEKEEKKNKKEEKKGKKEKEEKGKKDKKKKVEESEEEEEPEEEEEEEEKEPPKKKKKNAKQVESEDEDEDESSEEEKKKKKKKKTKKEAAKENGSSKKAKNKKKAASSGEEESDEDSVEDSDVPEKKRKRVESDGDKKKKKKK